MDIIYFPCKKDRYVKKIKWKRQQPITLTFYHIYQLKYMNFLAGANNANEKQLPTKQNKYETNSY